MFLKEQLKQYENHKIKLFVDMDGVIADYNFGSAKDFDKKRPLYDSIKKLEVISKMENVELFIFSATRQTEGIEQKNWCFRNKTRYFEGVSNYERLLFKSKYAN